MASLIRTIRRRLARLNAEPDTASATVKRKPNAPKRQRTKGGRKADTYRAAERAAVIMAMKSARKADRKAAIANRVPPPPPRPWARVTPPTYPQRAQQRTA